ncbi:DUF4160 domain-containing protein [Desulfolutivibrio sp.]|uniref:DUF4160 domain-containing protein n=1 Tax=Desulfolutivibrio sp. TaxID=2773296 RepID=UPI002F964142
MGTLIRFGKVRVAVFAWEHGRIHVHVIGPDFRCALDAETLEVLAGSAPRDVLREVRAWAAENFDRIAAAWEELNG